MFWRRWIVGLIAAALALFLLGGLLAYIFMDPLVDYWWFSHLGYGTYFFQRLLYRYMVFSGATLLFFLIFFSNFWVASHYIGVTEPPRTVKGLSAWKNYRELYRMFRTGSLSFYGPLSLVLAIIIANPLYRKWEMALLYVFGPSSGMMDPVYGRDISFYLFALPVHLLLIDRLLLAFLVLFAGLVLLYYLESRILSQQEAKLDRGDRTHLSVIMLLTFLMGFWKLMLQRYQLLYVQSHQPLFSGPGYIEMRITLPLIWLSALLLLATAISVVVYFNTRRKIQYPILCVVCFALALGGRYSNALLTSVEHYIVKPNELSRERDFISSNIESTLHAYNLDNVEYREYKTPDPPWTIPQPELAVSLRNIPVWDGEMLANVFEQLQQIRTYYTFPSVDVDRYNVNDLYQQVFLGAREIGLQELPIGAKNWVNTHLQYTHGIGAVMIPAAQGGEEAMTWFLHGIPPESGYGFHIDQPAIYYGLADYNYIIAPNDNHEMGYPTGDTTMMVDYEGAGGIPISSLFRKFVFSLYFNEKNILFTTQTNSQSRIMFRRNIVERIKALAPFFTLDRDPYVVVTPERLYWIQDAYTTSEWFPYSQPFDANGTNYIRNSVKIVVDAYDGNVTFYIADKEDPIIRAIDRIYPGLLKNMDEMPASLKPHVRYPEDIFEAQMNIYLKYHMRDPENFYQQEDIWEFPILERPGEKPGPIMPFYMTLNLIEDNRFEFLLLSAVNPKGRDNLRALVVAGSDHQHYGKFYVYNFPKGQLIYGPSQIEAVINQDTTVSQQFTLWGQSGSEVARGKMIILPVGHRIIYIQPIYLRASGKLNIPELKRLIISQGEVVVMSETLEQGFEELDNQLKARSERVKKRLIQLQTAPGEEPAPLPVPGAPVLTPQSGDAFQLGAPPEEETVPDKQTPPLPAPTPAPESGGAHGQ
jgi:uncharacterized membrane protein (UPF0182 family)